MITTGAPIRSKARAPSLSLKGRDTLDVIRTQRSKPLDGEIISGNIVLLAAATETAVQLREQAVR